jgi:FixJ family two-component response regulator
MSKLAGHAGRHLRVIAIIDDDESVRFALHSLLRSLGFDAAIYASAEDFLGSRRAAETACLIADVRMPGMSGFDLQRGLLAEGFELPTIFISALDEPAVRRRASHAGAVAFLRKPLGETPLLSAVCTALGIEAFDPAFELHAE